MKFSLVFFWFFCIGNAFAYNQTVNIYGWSAYILPETISNFEKEYGIKVKYDVFDSNETLDAKLLAGKTGYDIVFPSDNPFLRNQINLGLYKKLDKNKLPNLKNIDPFFLKSMRHADPGNRHALPWLWGLTGVGINKEKILEIDPHAPINSLEIIFNPKYAKKFSKCGINMVDSATEIIPMALIYNGFDPNSDDSKELKIAENTLLNIRNYIKTFDSSNYDDKFADESICLGISWSGDIVKANEKLKLKSNHTKLSFILPKEGFLMATDTMAIPTDAPNPENALLLMNYLMNPMIAAANSNYTRHFNANIASYKYLDKAMKKSKPSNSILEKGFRVDPKQGKTLRKINRIWTRIVTGS